MLKNRNDSVGLFGLFVRLFAVIILFAAGLTAYHLSVFYDHRTKFEQFADNAIKEKDYQSVNLALEELKIIESYYQMYNKPGLKFVADKYLFRDAFLFEAKRDYIIGDYKKVYEVDLKDHQEDYRALRIIGCAKYRQYEDAYHAAMKQKKPRAELAAIRTSLMQEVRPYFEKAVKLGPAYGFPDENFSNRWNYDLITDADAVKKALERPQESKQQMGKPDGKNPQKGNPRTKNLDEQEQDPKQPGTGGDKKRG